MSSKMGDLVKTGSLGPVAAGRAAAGVLLGAALLAGGCQSMTRSVISASDPGPQIPTPPPEVATDRPLVKVTAADLYSWGPGAAAQQLEFYDELERRDLVAHDDLLHAALLFAEGSSGATYLARLELAKGQGWIDRSFDRPGREAVTVGEASQIMARMMGTAGKESPEAAVAAFRALGLVPEVAEPSQGLTGPQLLALLTNSYDYLQSGETGQRPMAHRPQDPAQDWNATVAPPLTARTESFDQFNTPAQNAARAPQIDIPDAAVAAAPPPSPSGEPPRAMAEPLPSIPQADAPAAAVSAAPAPTTPPDAPTPQPAAAAETVEPEPPKPDSDKPAPTPRPWVGGKPLSKKRGG